MISWIWDWRGRCPCFQTIDELNTYKKATTNNEDSSLHSHKHIVAKCCRSAEFIYLSTCLLISDNFYPFLIFHHCQTWFTLAPIPIHRYNPFFLRALKCTYLQVPIRCQEFLFLFFFPSRILSISWKYLIKQHRPKLIAIFMSESYQNCKSTLTQSVSGFIAACSH